ncbi:unnamed protein product [Symbiodinium sp. CCMP2592]|nr:unnamed protein product [Symbiodinium sp. CCMP2592]
MLVDEGQDDDVCVLTPQQVSAKAKATKGKGGKKQKKPEDLATLRVRQATKLLPHLRLLNGMFLDVKSKWEEHADVLQTYRRLTNKGIDRDRAVKDASELGLGLSSALVVLRCKLLFWAMFCKCGFQENSR